MSSTTNLEERDGSLTVGSKFQTSAVGIVATAKPTYSEWEIALGVACDLHRSSQWWVGDLLNIGEHTYGEKYSQALEATGFEEQTLKNYKWVCARVEKSLRKDNLTFSHHALVASLQPDEQKQWLTLAVNNKWTVAQLREAMHEGEDQDEGEGDAITDDELSTLIREIEDYLDGLGDNHARHAALEAMLRKIKSLASKYREGGRE
jgi:DNA mismatch repair ATPase MutL